VNNTHLPFKEKCVWEDFPEDYPSMEFRLIYDGQLKAAGGGGRAGSRTSDKHILRKAFHSQLARLWELVPDLKRRSGEHSNLIVTDAERMSTGYKITTAAAIPRPGLWETLGSKHNKCGYKFVPLVSSDLQLTCGLDILLLQRDKVSAPLIHQTGDIDNRLKVLFDALQVPKHCEGIPSDDIETQPYFFCLLENDVLITDVTVTTDTLLTEFIVPDPPGSGARQSGKLRLYGNNGKSQAKHFFL
jgi:hypothetical protein